MKIFQATLDNLELASDWTTTKSIAEARRVHHHTLSRSLTLMAQAGLLDQRRERTTHYYRITALGKSTLDYHRAHMRVCECCGETKETMCFDTYSTGAQRKICNTCRLAKAKGKPVPVPAVVEVKYPMPWPWKYNGRVYMESAHV